jgi:hypothetical protein
MYIGVLHWLEEHELPCPVKYLVHIDCPGCGLQRSFIELLKGDFKKSFLLHPVTIPLVLFFLFSALHLIFKFKKGNSLIIYSYIFIGLIVLSNFIFKIFYPNYS